MTTMRELVDQTRSNLSGTLADSLTVLDAPYVAGSGIISLRYAGRNAVQGSLLSVGLNTFYVIEPDPTGQRIIVLPSYDGGPDVDMPAGSRVELRPRHSIYRVFNDLAGEIASMCAPSTGLWVPIRWESQVDTTYQTYPVPVGLRPERIIEVRYRSPGSPDQWNKAQRWDYQPDAGTGAQVRVFDFLPGGTDVQFLGGGRITAPTTLEDTYADIGLPDDWADIPMFGACATLAMTGEARRAQPQSQGDPRRAEELPMGFSTSVSREFRRLQQARIDDEHSRLVNLWSYTFPQPTGR